MVAVLPLTCHQQLEWPLLLLLLLSSTQGRHLAVMSDLLKTFVTTLHSCISKCQLTACPALPALPHTAFPLSG
jgi:hypothetical protein